MGDEDVTYARIDSAVTSRSFQSLRRELGVRGFGINVIALGPRERGRVHSHEIQEEVYLVLDGELTLELSGGQRTLVEGELARVPPSARRRLVNAGPQRLLVLALGASGEHAGRDGRAWTDWEESGPGAPPQEVPLPEDMPAT